MMSDKELLPDGSERLLRMAYTLSAVHGVTVLVVISCFSLVAVVGLLIAISVSAFNTRASLDQYLFVRTHVAAYFLSLLLSDLIQAIGSILNVKWIRDLAVVVDDTCTVQGVLKQTADVATAFWSLVIAIHTFCILFLDLKPNRVALLATLIAGWSGIAAIVAVGPAGMDTTRHGPFFGISGYWCWIAEEYPTSRITLDYLFMFIAAAFSFVIYSLIFLRLRGNIIVHNWHISFRRAAVSMGISAWRGQGLENRALAIAKKMLLYPVAYTIMILPIAASRFSSFAGQDVPFEVTIFADSVFLLSGVINVALFIMIRRILPPDSFIPKCIISRPRPMPELAVEIRQDSYYQSPDAASYDERKKQEYFSLGLLK